MLLDSGVEKKENVLALAFLEDKNRESCDNFGFSETRNEEILTILRFLVRQKHTYASILAHMPIFVNT